MATLPKFVAGEAHERDLIHISVGKKRQMPPATAAVASKKAPPIMMPKNPPAVDQRKKKATVAVASDKAPAASATKKVKPEPQDSLPFAVVPVERMTYQQLIAAIKNRGLAFPKPMSIVNMRATLVEAGFSLQEEEAIQKAQQIKSLNASIPKLTSEMNATQAAIDKIERKLPSDKLYIDLTKDVMVSILKKNFGEVSYMFKRDEVAGLLHGKMYQGGGTSEARLAFHKKKLAAIQADIRKTLDTTLQAKKKAGTHKRKKTSGKSSTKVAFKRPLAHSN